MNYLSVTIFQRKDARRAKIAWDESTRAICGKETEVVFLSRSLEAALFFFLSDCILLKRPHIAISFWPNVRPDPVISV